MSVRCVVPRDTGDRRADDPGGADRVAYADVVGDLLALDGERAVVEARQGLVEVPLADVALARVAPPSTADELALEGVAAHGWRAAEVEQLGGWLLRCDDGGTQRANSVLPLRLPRVGLDEALDRARAWYAERGRSLRLQVPTEARRLLDAELGERGWEPSEDVHVLATRLDTLVVPPPTARVDGPGPLDVGITDLPDEAWLARHGRSDAAAAALVSRHDRAGFAAIRGEDGTALAVARGVVDEGWLGVFGLEVDPSYRRAGFASAVMAALWQWGLEHGATRSYLQVASSNTPALSLYERLGYWHHHDYRYRSDPEGTAG